MAERGYMYLRAIGEGAVIQDRYLRDPYCTGFETSVNGKLSWLRIPAEISRLTIQPGTAIRVPSVIGCRLAQNSRWLVMTSDEFYSRGYAPPDGYALAEEVERLTAALAESKAAVPVPSPPVETAAPAAIAEKPAAPALVCPHCEKVCGSKAGLGSHIAAKHPEATE